MAALAAFKFARKARNNKSSSCLVIKEGAQGKLHFCAVSLIAWLSKPIADSIAGGETAQENRSFCAVFDFILGYVPAAFFLQAAFLACESLGDPARRLTM